MASYVLVHGSWHGAWCWYRVVPALERRGHRVTAVDLPGHGADRSGAAMTLAGYADVVMRAIDAEPEPVIVVAHGMGGVVASQAAEWRSDRIRSLIYVSAYVPADGQSMHALTGKDETSLVERNLIIDQARGVHWIAPEAVTDALHADCPETDVALFRLSTVPEPLQPVMTPVALSAERFGRVRKMYIETSRDRALSPHVQQQMHRAARVERVHALPTGHSPFLPGAATCSFTCR